MDGQDKAVSWYNLPFYRSLTEEILLMGAPRNVIIINAIVSFMFVMYFHFVYILALSLAVHALCVYLAKDDAQFFDCLSQYMYKDNYYST